jgi:hypothetical protein
MHWALYVLAAIGGLRCSRASVLLLFARSAMPKYRFRFANDGARVHLRTAFALSNVGAA